MLKMLGSSKPLGLSALVEDSKKSDWAGEA